MATRKSRQKAMTGRRTVKTDDSAYRAQLEGRHDDRVDVLIDTAVREGEALRRELEARNQAGRE
jgi:hypothetical protein